MGWKPGARRLPAACGRAAPSDRSREFLIGGPMNRFRIALMAGLATLALGVISVPAAAASNGTTVPPKVTSLPPLDTIQIHGVAKNGKQFSGTYAIQRFIAGATKV